LNSLLLVDPVVVRPAYDLRHSSCNLNKRAEMSGQQKRSTLVPLGIQPQVSSRPQNNSVPIAAHKGFVQRVRPCGDPAISSISDRGSLIKKLLPPYSIHIFFGMDLIPECVGRKIKLFFVFSLILTACCTDPRCSRRISTGTANTARYRKHPGKRSHESRA
jgi:hypothetical protein